MALPLTHSSLESGFQPSRTAPALDRSARSGPSKTLVKGLLGLVSLLVLLLVTVPGAAAATANRSKVAVAGGPTTNYGTHESSTAFNRLNNPTTLSDNLGYDPGRGIDGTSATVSTPARASAPQISVAHTAPKCARDAKVGMSPEQLAINEACGNELAEANLQTKPEWLQDLVHGNQAFAEKAWPLVALGIAGALGATGTAGAKPRTNAKNGFEHRSTSPTGNARSSRPTAPWMRDRTVNGND